MTGRGQAINSRRESHRHTEWLGCCQSRTKSDVSDGSSQVMRKAGRGVVGGQAGRPSILPSAISLGKGREERLPWDFK